MPNPDAHPTPHTDSDTNPYSRAKFEPFANNAQSMQVGQLIIENQTDKLIIYGDIDIMANADGLAHAKRLQTVLNDAVAYLQTKIDVDMQNDCVTKGEPEPLQKQTRNITPNPFA